MKAPALYKQLSLYAQLTDKRALSQSYRALVIAPGHVRAASVFGSMESEINLGLNDEVYVNADDFLQVLRSLPDAELEMRVSSGGLHWTCGPAKGHLGLMSEDREKIEIARPAFEGQIEGDSALDSSFGVGLELGGLACGSMALRTLGLQGVQIRNDGDASYAYASDNTTISSCKLGPPITIAQREGSDAKIEVVTLLPDATDLLAALLKRDEGGMLAFNHSSAFCITESTQLLLRQVAPLRYNIQQLIGEFSEQSIKLPLMQESVAAFLRRAEALSDDHQRTVVSISVVDGNTRLVFSEARSSTEEYCIVQGSPNVSVASIEVEAQRMAKALAHADTLVFDYADKNVLVLRGNRDFTFAIMGRRE